MRKLLVSVLLLTSSLASAAEVNIYSYRQDFLIKPILEEFTRQTGIETNVLFAKKGLIERVKREGKLSPADLVLTSDFAKLLQLKQEGLTQAVDSDVLGANIPVQFQDQDGHWFALTKRVRGVYSSKERQGKLPELTYEELADEQYKGKICMRSGKHPYNVSLVASMIAHHGEAETETWLRGLKANQARRPQGNDRAQVKAVKDGVCDLALGNSYYLGKMLQNEEQISWANAVEINFPNQTNRGAHINVSGMVMTPHAPNRDAAQQLMEFLSSDEAQRIYAELNMEYPVKPGVAVSELVASWGEFKEDDLKLNAIADNREAALKLMDKVKFDL